MWVCLNDAFFSIVDDGHKDGLLVRARRAGDLERHFAGFEVQETPARDYRYRARVGRMFLAETLYQAAMNIDYSNFKNSVKDHKLHDAYSQVWSVMGSLQPGGPYNMRRRNSAQ